jgi:hypothetical protein
MKRKIYVTIAAFAIGLFIMQSCGKENLKTSTSTADAKVNSTYQVENGRLVFNTVSAVDSLASKLSKKSQDELNLWEDSIQFDSYRKYVHKIDMQNWTSYCVNGDTVTEAITYKDLSPSYNCVLNQKGELQIGDSIYYFTEETVYIIPYKGESALQNTKTELSQTTKAMSSGIRSYALEFKPLKTKITNLKSDAITYGQWGLLNNGIQYTNGEWDGSGHAFRFVVSAHTETCVLSGHLNVVVNNYLQYFKPAKGWYLAGELCYKTIHLNLGHSSISNLSLSLSDNLYDWTLTGDNGYAGAVWYNVNSTGSGIDSEYSYMEVMGTIYDYTLQLGNNNSWTLIGTEDLPLYSGYEVK